MKKGIKIILVGIFMVSLVTGCGCSRKETNKDEEIKSNTNEGVIKDQTVEVFEFKNTSLIREGNNTVLETTVTNTSTTDQELQEFKIEVKDKDGNVMETLIGFVGDKIKAGETRVINSYCGTDLTEATNIVYTVVK